MDIVTRLKAYMDHVGLQISQFADLAQIPRPTLSQILSGRNKKISNELLSKLHTAFPSLNISWLLFGDGEMDAAPSQGNAAPAINFDQNAADQHSGTSNSSLGNAPKAMSHPFAPQKKADVEVPRLDFNYTGEVSQEREDAKPNIQAKKETAQPQLSLTPDSTKKIQNIMVFYSDNSFEIFTPSIQ